MLILVAALVSCNKNASDSAENQAKEYIISIGLGGEITGVSIGDLTKSGENNDLYGIQVDSREAGTTGGYISYAYGVFDTLEGLTITLLGGREYVFKANLVIDGKELLKDYADGYSTPFAHYGTPSGFTPVGTVFNYTADQYLPYNIWNPDEVYLADGNSYYHPEIDRYYGELEGFVPDDSNSVTIEMKRMVFGMNVIAEGLTEGKLKVQMANAPLKEIVYPETELDEIFSLKNVYDAWPAENYKETITVSFTWVKDNEEETLLASGEFDFYRNKKTTITVQVQSQNPQAPVSVSLDDTPMGDGGTYEIGDNGSGDYNINS